MLYNDVAQQYIINYDNGLLIDYLNKSSNILYSYRKDDTTDIISYSGTLMDGSKFMMNEYAPMNFKIMFYN